MAKKIYLWSLRCSFMASMLVSAGLQTKILYYTQDCPPSDCMSTKLCVPYFQEYLKLVFFSRSWVTPQIPQTRKYVWARWQIKVTHLPLVSWKKIPFGFLVPLLATELSVTVALHVPEEIEFLQIGKRFKIQTKFLLL